MRVKHLSNIYDPSKKNPELRLPYLFQDYTDLELIGEDKKSYLDWIARNVIGEPKATESYTVEQLKAMNMVGLYAPEDES